MKRMGMIGFALVLAAVIVFTTGIQALAGFPGDIDKTAGLAKIQVPFIENRGQVPGGVAYYAQTFGGLFYLTNDGAMVLLIPGKVDPAQGAMLVERLEGTAGIRPEGLKRAETIVNVYSGSRPANWRRGLPTFHSLTLNTVYDGIELEMKASGKNIEKIFRIHPEASPSAIRVRIGGAVKVATGEKGQLLVQTPFGPVTYSPPLAYQELEGGRRPVQVAYAVQGTSYGFKVGQYDRNRDLVIDPLLQSTYVGGMGGDSVQAVQVHPTTGKVYICGTTNSTGFSPMHLSQTDSDAYVARLDAALTSFEQVTRLEGSGNDSCQDLRVDATAGRVFLLGRTNSSDFLVQSAAQETHGGGYDAFVASLDTDLTVVSSTYLGGSGLETPVDMALNESTGDLYIVGDTDSADFPTTAGAPQPTLNPGGSIPGVEDGYVVRYDSALAVQMATYLGGAIKERLGAVSVHPASGDVYVAGDTNSIDFPNRSGGAQSTNAGIYDAFVARYTSSLTTLVQTSYLGGASGSESEVDMEIHPFTGKIFVTGLTNSFQDDFPVVNPVQSDFGGQYTDLFAAVFNTSLTTVEAATYLGGNDTEETFPGHMALTSGDVYIAGETDSSGFASTDFATGGLFVASFSSSLTTLKRKVYVGGYNGSGLQMHPANGDLYLVGDAGTGLPGTSGGAQPIFGGGTYDAFVMRLSPDLTSIVQATYLGGSDTDRTGNLYNPRLAIHPLSDNIYVAGITAPVGMNSYVGDFPGTSGGAQDTHGGAMDGFVAYFDTTLTASTGTTCTDNDDDGYGAGGTDLSQCPNSTTVEDCDDNNSARYPGNMEICDGLDNDCSNGIDDNLTAPLCSLQAGVCSGDVKVCDGSNGWLECTSVEYGSGYEATEVTCDGLDNDCDGGIDEGVDYTYHLDSDGDGYGSVTATSGFCDDSPAPGYTTDGSDCNDSNADVNPAATEVCYNGEDDDCDAGELGGGTDCWDNDCIGSGSCIFVLDPDSYSFGQIEIGQTRTVTATLRNQSAVAYTVTDIYTTDSTGSPDNWSLANFPDLPFLLPAFGERTVDVTFMPEEEFIFRTRIAIDFGASLTYTSPGYMEGEGIASSGGGGGGGGGCSLSGPDQENGIGPVALLLLFVYGHCLWRRKR